MANLSSTREHGEHILVGSARLEMYAQAHQEAAAAGRAPPQPVVNFEVNDLDELAGRIWPGVKGVPGVAGVGSGAAAVAPAPPPARRRLV